MRRILLLAALAAIGACGKSDDDQPAAGAPVAATPAAQPAAGTEPKKDPLQVNIKVEDVVPANEVATIRHRFRERDFAPDLAGDENRDPFQSFVVAQPGVGVTTGPQQPGTATLTCTAKQQVATNYALRDLRLAAIITRGLRRYALFQDTADLGHLVTKLDCLGKEKARVKEIGDRTVTLELVPDQIANQPARAPEDRSIPLYPSELSPSDISSGESDDHGQDAAPQSNVPAPRTIPPPPTAPSGPMLRNVPVPPPGGTKQM